MESPRVDVPPVPGPHDRQGRGGTLVPIAMSVAILAGVGVVAGLEMAVYAIGMLGSHAPTSDTGTTLAASGALAALGVVVVLAGRLLWGRGSVVPALRVAVAGVGPFLVALLIRPKALLALVPSFEIGPHEGGTRLVGLVAVAASVAGVIWATRAAATRDSGGRARRG